MKMGDLVRANIYYCTSYKNSCF